jgi:hypothetical protein
MRRSTGSEKRNNKLLVPPCILFLVGSRDEAARPASAAQQSLRMSVAGEGDVIRSSAAGGVGAWDKGIRAPRQARSVAGASCSAAKQSRTTDRAFLPTGLATALASYLDPPSFLS